MFRRNKVVAHSTHARHGGPPQVSAAASSAANLAFLNNQKSNSSLSSAAAAAALRSNPHLPTDVANVHTKRLQRRNSGSSNGSPRPGLERRSSLIDRSLRSPSPGRDGTGPPRSSAPPMPPLPKGVERTPSGRHRAASLEPPMRVSSPNPTQPGGRGVSLDRAQRNPMPIKTAQVGKPKLAKLSEQNETPQRTSVNFSRPMSPPPQSPSSPTSPSSPASGQTGWFAGPVGSGAQPRQTLEPLKPKEASTLSASTVSGIQAGLQGVADRPVKKKKKRLSGSGNQGTHLSQGSMDLTGTAVAQTRAATASPQELDSPATASYAASESGRSSFDSASDVSSVADRPEPFKTRAGALLARQPSLIDETPEYEQQPERANTSRKVEAVPQRSPVDASRVAAVTAPEPTAVQPKEIVASNLLAEANGAPVQRTSSLSPTRAAKFSSKPVEYLDGIKHQPPNRSVSPAKSALKHSPSSSIRTASPDVRFASGPSSEVGDLSASMSRKKANRVSFDETPTIVSGLQTSRYASDSVAVVQDPEDEADDIMKPRPALPSFGSVRGKQAEDSAESTSRSHTENPLGHSTDRVLGGILIGDHTNKRSSLKSSEVENNAGHIHDPNLPLAPEVTSVEGTGFSFDSDSDESEHPVPASTTHTVESHTVEPQPETIAQAVAGFQSHKSPGENQNAPKDVAVNTSAAQVLPVSNEIEGSKAEALAVPVIAVEPATPSAEEENKEMIMPGSFPGAWDDEAAPTAQAPAAVSVSEVSAKQPQTSRQSHSIQAIPTVDDNSDSESDTSSIWSDAEEDLPSGPGGFASLNAIVDSPSVVPPPTTREKKHLTDSTSEAALGAAPPSPTAAAWDDTTAYWRGLSEQRRKELEVQALQKSTSAEANSEESSDEEDIEKTLAKEIPRPATPPQKSPKRALKLDSPIAFQQPATSVTTAARAPAPPRVKKEPKMRTSMRESRPMSEEEGPRMKTSLRNNAQSQAQPRKSGEHHFRSSMRGPQQPRPENVRRHSSGMDESKWSGQQNARSSNINSERPRTAGGVPAPKASTTPAVPPLRRQDSDDSVSSFRRQRPSSSRGDGAVNMRRSMRGAVPTAPPPRPEQRPQSSQDMRKSGRFSLRSLSPAGRQPQDPAIRSTLRSSVNAPTLREQEPKKKSRLKSPTRLGFGKSKPKPVESPRAAPPVAASGFKSRISADSDDEDVGRSTFVSRFADSDDEMDSPEPREDLTPVRGIPRKRGEEDGDSTDLDDSDNERTANIPPVPSLRDVDHAHGKSPTTNGKTASVLSAGSLRKGTTTNGLGASKHAPAPVERPQQKRRLSWLGLGSSKRSSSMPPMAMAASPPPSRDKDGSKPNLLRRNTPTGLPLISEDSTSTNNWPLGAESKERPTTSDGPGTKLQQASMRPPAGQRRATADFVGSERTAVEESLEGTPRKRVGFNFEAAEPVYSTRTGRKKKFGTLRKMFGLND